VVPEKADSKLRLKRSNSNFRLLNLKIMNTNYAVNDEVLRKHGFEWGHFNVMRVKKLNGREILIRKHGQSFYGLDKKIQMAVT